MRGAAFMKNTIAKCGEFINYSRCCFPCDLKIHTSVVVCVDISCAGSRTPVDGGVRFGELGRKMLDQFADLEHTHTHGILIGSRHHKSFF